LHSLEPLPDGFLTNDVGEVAEDVYRQGNRLILEEIK